MKLNKLVIIILVLLSLLLSALGSAYYFYMKHQETLNTTNELKSVFVASSEIKKNTLITSDLIKEMKIEKKYILSTPLLKKEILGKIAKENILKNEVIRKEKLSTQVDEGDIDLIPFQQNSYNMAFNLFSNPNFSLKRGDFINIVAVHPNSKDKDNMDYTVQYIAKSIKVIGFLEEGNSVKNTYRFVKRKVETKKKTEKPVYETVKVFADELVVDIDSSVILALLEQYNKGKQLWMVKTKEAKEEKKEPVVEAKKEIEPIVKPTKKVVKKAIKKAKVYKVQWYKPKNITYTQVATIHYADINKQEKSDKVTLHDKLSKRCEDRSKLLLGVAKDIYLYQSTSLQSKVVRKIHRNYLIPYVKKVNKNWYEVCDGSFVHTNEANEISFKKAIEKLSWKQKE